MRDRLIAFLFWVQGALCAASSGGQLECPSADPSATLWAGPWHLLGGDWLACVIGSCHWGHPLCCPPAPCAWPQPADPSMGSGLEGGVYLPCSLPAGRALPIPTKPPSSKRALFDLDPREGTGFSPFVSRLKTWPSPPLSLKQPSQHFCSAITFSF